MPGAVIILDRPGGVPGARLPRFGADRRRPRLAARTGRRGAQRGQRAARAEHLSRRSRCPGCTSTTRRPRRSPSEIVRYAVERVRDGPAAARRPAHAAELRAAAGQTITAGGHRRAARRCGCSPTCSPRRASPSTTRGSCRSSPPRRPRRRSCSTSSSARRSIYAGSWLEGGGAVYAENQALRWIADLAGLPAEAGGVFVSGGTAGNLSALIAARHRWRHARRRRARPHPRPAARLDAARTPRSPRRRGRWTPTCSSCPPTSVGRLHGDALRGDGRRTRRRRPRAGVRDRRHRRHDQRRRGRRPRRRRPTPPPSSGTWLHVDGAYGGAALAAPSVRRRFAGIERADSFIVDPHKWLFAPFDCCALLYRDPVHRPRRAHPARRVPRRAPRRRRRSRVEPERLRPPPVPPGPRPAVLVQPGDVRHRRLPRRGRDDARRHPRAARELIDAAAHLELLVRARAERAAVPPPSAGRRRATRRGATRCSPPATRSSCPTSWNGETVLRLCIVNPRTTVDDIAWIVDSLSED